MAKAGVDVRNKAWEELVNWRNKLLHEGPTLPSHSYYEPLNARIPELQYLLDLLCPLDLKKARVDLPQVSIEH